MSKPEPIQSGNTWFDCLDKIYPYPYNEDGKEGLIDSFEEYMEYEVYDRLPMENVVFEEGIDAVYDDDDYIDDIDCDMYDGDLYEKYPD